MPPTSRSPLDDELADALDHRDVRPFLDLDPAWDHGLDLIAAADRPDDGEANAVLVRPGPLDVAGDGLGHAATSCGLMKSHAGMPVSRARSAARRGEGRCRPRRMREIETRLTPSRSAITASSISLAVIHSESLVMTTGNVR